MSFDISVLFTSIPVDKAPDTINQLVLDHQESCDFKSKIEKPWNQAADHLNRQDVMLLLKLVLNNCVISFQDKFYKQLHSAEMGSPCSPVMANIEYFESTLLGSESPVTSNNTWLGYVDDILTIIKKGN